jgi:hypothetical protein
MGSFTLAFLIVRHFLVRGLDGRVVDVVDF